MIRVRSMMPFLSVTALFLVMAPARAQSPSDLFQRALRVERVEGDLEEAIRLYRQVVELDDRTLAARALLRIGESYERLGREGAEDAYRRLVSEFADQSTEAQAARDRLAMLDLDARARLATGSPSASAGSGPNGLNLRLVWADASDVSGEPTPDGTELTYIDWSTSGLAVRDLATGDKRVLVTHGGSTYPLESSVSNDGRTVAYHFIPGPWQPQLRVIGMDGTGERTLIDNATVEIDYISPHGWTPDDSEILVGLAWMDGHSSLALVSVTDGSMRTVRSFAPSTSLAGFALSPDGHWIAFARYDGDNRSPDIFVVASDGSTERTLISHPASDMRPIWSPDGAHLLFASDRGGSIDLWAVRVSAGDPADDPFLIRRDIGQDFAPLAFTSDGSLTYVRNTNSGDIFTVGFDARAARVDGTPVRAVQVYQGYHGGAAWAPNGSTLAYVSRRPRIYPGNTASLIVRDGNTGREFEPVPDLLLHRQASRPAVSHDGRRVAVRSRLLGEGTELWRVRVIDVADGTVRTLPHPSGSNLCATCVVMFSNDGTAVYYFDVIHRPDWVPGDECPDRACEEYRGLIRQDITTGEYERVFALDIQERDVYRWSLSPDETRIAFLEHDPGGQTTTVHIGDVRTATSTRIAAIAHDAEGCTPARRNNVPAWTPDGSRILFVCERPETQDGKLMHELVSVPVDGGPVQSTGLVMEELRHVTLRSDGSIGFTAGPRTYLEVWVMSGLSSVAALAAAR